MRMPLISRHSPEIQTLIKRVKREQLMRQPLGTLEVPLIRGLNTAIDTACEEVADSMRTVRGSHANMPQDRLRIADKFGSMPRL